MFNLKPVTQRNPDQTLVKVWETRDFLFRHFNSIDAPYYLLRCLLGKDSEYAGYAWSYSTKEEIAANAS